MAASPLLGALSASAVPEYSESRSVVLQWKITDLKTHFESSKGDVKSRCVKSVPFDGGRWQLFFYASSGVDNHLGLYLAAIPTLEERERGQNNTWEREGTFRFCFDLKASDASSVYKSMEAQNHVFSSENFNWGWNSYWKRQDAYFNNSKVRSQDAFLVVCTVISASRPPEISPKADQRLIPLALVSAFASLFDDPNYSDVVFRIQQGDTVRRVYASRKILSLRSEYYANLFDGAWAESQSDDGSMTDVSRSDVQELEDEEASQTSDEDGLDLFESADTDMETDEDFDVPSFLRDGTSTPLVSDDHAQLGKIQWSTPSKTASAKVAKAATSSASRSDVEAPRETTNTSTLHSEGAETFSTPRSPRSKGGSKSRKPVIRRRARVNITDASYEAYRALLCWLYTDIIYFRTLNSLYYAAKATPATNADPRYRSLADFHRVSAATQHVPTIVGKRPARPCSAKAIYTLADKLNLPELKARAFDHIERSLSVQNCAFECFSAFSARFPEVQGSQIEFLLDNWSSVRASPAMKQVLEMVPKGHWPAFSSVWMRLLPQLDFHPMTEAPSTVTNALLPLAGM